MAIIQTIKYSFLTLLMTSVVMSCQHVDFSEYDSGGVDGGYDAGEVEINMQAKTSDTLEFIASKGIDTGTLYASYLFGPDKACIIGHQGYASDDMEYTFSEDLSTGEYTVATLAGYEKGQGFSSAGLKLESALSFPKTLHNLYLGHGSVNVSEENGNYDVSITATRLMAELSVTISNVPADAQSVTLELPSQASQFTMKGDVIGMDKSQTLTLTKGEATTTGAGTYYTWGVTDQLIYPSADGCTSMPINVVVQRSGNVSTTLTASYLEVGKTCCTRGTKTTLAATMPTNTKSSITLDDSYKSENTGTLSLTKN